MLWFEHLITTVQQQWWVGLWSTQTTTVLSLICVDQSYLIHRHTNDNFRKMNIIMRIGWDIQLLDIDWLFEVLSG